MNSFINRRNFFYLVSVTGISLFLPKIAYTKTYLTPKQAKQILYGNQKAVKQNITISKKEAKIIRKLSKVRVRNLKMNIYKLANGDWLIFDEVIGKHENIDVAVALNKLGEVKGVEILVYRETYGHEVRNKKWRQQFHGKTAQKLLKLDQQIKNISGATLSCRNITEAINRLTHTWQVVLKNHQ